MWVRGTHSVHSVTKMPRQHPDNATQTISAFMALQCEHQIKVFLIFTGKSTSKSVWRPPQCCLVWACLPVLKKCTLIFTCGGGCSGACSTGGFRCWTSSAGCSSGWLGLLVVWRLQYQKSVRNQTMPATKVMAMLKRSRESIIATNSKLTNCAGGADSQVPNAKC